MFQFIKNNIQKVRRTVRNAKFRYWHEDNLRRIFEMSQPDKVPTNLDFSRASFEKLIKACGIEITRTWPSDGWELHFNGKRKRIDGPKGDNVNITVIRKVTEFLKGAGVKEPTMIYDYLPGS